ncbi:hypothetical protein L596_014499 [Steinernema carpocapsae]|uniref:G-protein coupled receptors family 1 profile domain-containing protein n=1 Tax=Steinernema carpocapsae TaxID=34508 RepID=A0A4V6A2T9_STECR|nr:hypothetical protein L596_014499 [Steinernema carpocapsae]
MTTDSSIAGITYTAIMMVCLPLQIAILSILWRKSEFQNSTAYNIMIQMGIVDLIFMWSHLVSGIMSLCNSKIWLYLEIIAGSITAAGWIGMVGFALILALNRFLVFSDNSTVTPSFYNKLKITVWILTAICFIIYLLPGMWITYNLERNCWIIASGVISKTTTTAHMWMIFAMLLVEFGLTLGSVGAIVRKVKKLNYNPFKERTFREPCFRHTSRSAPVK